MRRLRQLAVAPIRLPPPSRCGSRLSDARAVLHSRENAAEAVCGAADGWLIVGVSEAVDPL